MFKYCLVTLEGCGRGAVALWWELSLESRTGAVEPRPGKNQHFEKSQKVRTASENKILGPINFSCLDTS